MSKNLMLKMIGKITYKTAKKKFDATPVYKPLKVEMGEIKFNSQLIDSCHYLHKSMMFLLERQDLATLDFPQQDLDNSRDYAAAIMLQWYFTTWLKDVIEMEKLNGMRE